MRVIIEDAAATDTAALAALAAETFPLACPPHVSATAIAAFIDAHLTASAFAHYLQDPAYDVIVARSGEGALDGYALAARRSPDPDIARMLPPGRITELSKLYVRPGAHGSGIASRLLAAVVERARSTDARTVWLGTNHANARARRFYEREGFTLVGTRRFLVGERWEDDVVYALSA